MHSITQWFIQQTMRKILYILLFALIGLVSCSNNNDEKKGDEWIPPTPPTDLLEDQILGTWETYYSQKEIQVKFSSGVQTTYPGFRLTEYDGFKTTFFKDPATGEYKFKTFNVLYDLIEEGTYRTKVDSVLFEWKSKHTGKDTTTYQRIREIGATDGVVKWFRNYPGRTADGTKYNITDTRANREINTNPTATNGVNPAKVKIDFDDLSKGKWQINGFFRYYGEDIDPVYNEKMGKVLIGTTFDFYTEGGDRRCIMRGYNRDTDKWEEVDYPVTVVDDVIYFFYKKKVPIDKGENGEEFQLVNESFFLWVYEKKSANAFTDYKEERSESNLSKIVKVYMNLVRI